MIPVPPLETQRAIVAEIETEQALVDANKQLITRFEAKIKATINRIWGWWRASASVTRMGRRYTDLKHSRRTPYSLALRDAMLQIVC